MVVTASRIVRDGYEAPTPATVVGEADIQRSSTANIAEYINQLPQVGAASAASARSAGFTSGAVAGSNSFNLRNLGLVRTLTLLDGRRVVNAALTNVVDINMLPTNLVSRVDIVTGGASAAWGSDVVAGVINFVLDKTFTGIKGSAAYGVSDLGDGDNITGDIAFGARFAGGRGHVLLSARYEDLKGIDRVDSRSWYTGYKAVRNRNFTTTNGQPGFIATDHAGIAIASSGGVAFGLNGQPLGFQFINGGATAPWSPATQGTGAIGIGGSTEDVAGGYTMLADTDNQQVFGRVSYDLTDRVNVYVEAGRGWEAGSNTTSHAMLFSKPANLIIKNDNAFLPAGLTFAGAPGTPAFILFKIFNEDGLAPLQSTGKRQQDRLVFGVDGSKDWFNDSFKWNAYLQHGESKAFNEVKANPIWGNLVLALDAVRNPAVGGVSGVAVGAPVCRSTITNPANGCQPLNFFGKGSPSQAALAYILGSSNNTNHVKQDVAAASFQFDPFELPAGPVSLAGGAEIRRESYHTTVSKLDNQPNPEVFYFGNVKPSQGSYDVKEAFAEVIVPVVKDVTLIKSFDLNAAFRRTDYSTSGAVSTWKVGGTWEVTEDLRFRGTRSRDIRAPNLSELFATGSGFGIGIVTPITGQSVTSTVLPGGNVNLKPEIANTTSFGVVYRPSFLPGFSASIDYYKIKVRGEILALGHQQIVNRCFGGANDAFACSLITLNPNPLTPGVAGQLQGAIIRPVPTNEGSRDMNGVDIDASYRRDLADLFGERAPGAIDIRAVGSYLGKFTQTFSGVTNNYKDIIFAGVGPAVGSALAGGPEWRWMLSGSYKLGPSNTTLTVRYIGGGVVNNEPLGTALHVDKNDIPSVTYVDLVQSWDVKVAGVQGQIFGKVENLFDQDPPRVPSTQGTSWASSGTDNSYYDLIGRYFRVGFRFKY